MGKNTKSKKIDGISFTGTAPTVEECLFSNDHRDEIGRMFCEHNKDYCHLCCVDHRPINRMMEESAGLKKKESPLEEAARMYATACRALRGMERMNPRPSPEVFDQNIQWRDDNKAKLDAFARAGEDVQSVLQAAMDRETSDEVEQRAMVQAMARRNPGQTTFEIGGQGSQAIYDDLIRAPQAKATRADFYTCSYCGITKTTKLLACSRCKKASYCGKECQKAHWPSHKKHECVPVDKEPKKLALTWAQVEAHGGQPAPGKLQVKAILDESMMRQVVQAKDRVGMCKRIAAYNDLRKIPGLTVGATFTWKNPRFHYFMDGSSGARIEEEDLPNITVTTL